jgi:hypothetical protein
MPKVMNPGAAGVTVPRRDRDEPKQFAPASQECT